MVEQIIALLSPIVAGASGIIGALIVFVSRIRSLKNEVKAQMLNNKAITDELAATKQALVNLNQKVSYLVEEIKKEVK